VIIIGSQGPNGVTVDASPRRLGTARTIRKPGAIDQGLLDNDTIDEVEVDEPAPGCGDS
jgi:hypothetical protein